MLLDLRKAIINFLYQRGHVNVGHQSVSNSHRPSLNNIHPSISCKLIKLNGYQEK